jgi:hypothetical protein
MGKIIAMSCKKDLVVALSMIEVTPAQNTIILKKALY